MNSSSRRRRKNSDNQIYQTEFGPIDGRTRRLAGYLIMALMSLIAIGATSAVLSATPGPLDTPAFTLVAIGMVWIFCLGIPAVVMFGQKEPDYAEYSEHTETRSPSIFASVNDENTSDNSDECQETTTEDSMTVEEMENKPESKQKTEADYSYRNEWPKGKRIDGRIK